jgi:hypothetical protein
MEQAQATAHPQVTAGVEAMLGSTCDERGTVRALAQEVEESLADGGCMLSLLISPIISAKHNQVILLIDYQTSSNRSGSAINSTSPY